MLAEVDRVRSTGPGDMAGHRHPPHTWWPSMTAPLELGPQIKQPRFAVGDLFPGPLGCDAADAPGGSHVVGDLLARGALKQRVELVELPAYAAADLFAELEYPFVGDRVAGVVAVLSAGDHAGVVQDPEVL